MPYFYHNQLNIYYQGILQYNPIIGSNDRPQHVGIVDLT